VIHNQASQQESHLIASAKQKIRHAAEREIMYEELPNAKAALLPSKMASSSGTHRDIQVEVEQEVEQEIQPNECRPLRVLAFTRPVGGGIRLERQPYT